jgi:hypothetical protein
LSQFCVIANNSNSTVNIFSNHFLRRASSIHKNNCN